MFLCKHCKRNAASKAGLRKNKVGFTQRYFCTECKKHFVNRKGFENYRNVPEVITAALDLRAKGLSLADVVDHLDQHYRVSVTRQTVLDWQNKFGEKINSFAQTLKPFLGIVFHADEMFVKVRKNWTYYWDCIDYKTKFIAGDHFSTVRSDEEAVIFLNKIKLGSPTLPKTIHTDCSYDYPPAFRRVFPRRKIHKKFPAWKNKHKNNPIERFHNTLKQRYKTFRGFHTVTSAKSFFTFYKNYYNFIRKHTTLKFQTPAQAAKIQLNLGKNRFKSIIELFLALIRARPCSSATAILPIN